MALTNAVMYCCVALAAVYLTSAVGDKDPQDKEVFNLIPSITTCNYTEQGSSSCLSCSEYRYCFENNVGLLWQCSGLLPHCNNGHCSYKKSKNCTSLS